MSNDISSDVRSKLEKKVKAAGMHSKFISEDAEKELISFAVENGIEPEDAEGIIGAIAEEKGYVVEEHLDEILEVIVKHLGKVDKAEFMQVMAMAKEFSKGVIPDPLLQKKLKKLMVDQGISADSGGVFSSDWFKAI